MHTLLKQSNALTPTGFLKSKPSFVISCTHPLCSIAGNNLVNELSVPYDVGLIYNTFISNTFSSCEVDFQGYIFLDTITTERDYLLEGIG